MWSREDLLNSLKELGLLRSSTLERAWRAVDQASLLPGELSALAYADQPCPMARDLQGPTMPSPRCLIAALELLEVPEGARVLVYGARGGYAAALLASIVGPDRVALAEPDPARRELASRRLADAGFDGVRVVPTPPDERFDRILIADPVIPRPRDLASRLNDLGFLVGRGRGVDDLAFVKIVRSGEETVRMTIGHAPPRPLAGPRPTSSHGTIDYARLFAVEDLLTHAWEGRVVGHYDQHFQDVVDETFADGPLDLESFDSKRNPEKLAARRAFQAAYILQSAGELERAEDGYERSVRLAPSSEAHTFLGWTCSFAGRYDDAIEACRRAIAADPTLGNPYNDIGAYLIELGRLEESVPWLEKALTAARYCCYFYAHANLARVYLQLGFREKARKHLKAALDVNPDYGPARELLRRLDEQGSYYA